MGNEGYKKIIDKQSKIYDQESRGKYFEKTAPIFRKLVPKGDSVLEIGSGTGRYVIDFIKHGIKAVGIDYSKKMVEVARKNSKKAGIKCKFVYSDVEKKIELKEKFDIALLIGNWEYFNDPVKALENIKKALNKDGRIIISTLNIWSWPLITFLEKSGIKKLSPAFWHFNSLPWRLKSYVKRSGFEVEKRFFNYYFIDVVYILKIVNK